MDFPTKSIPEFSIYHGVGQPYIQEEPQVEHSLTLIPPLVGHGEGNKIYCSLVSWLSKFSTSQSNFPCSSQIFQISTCFYCQPWPFSSVTG